MKVTMSFEFTEYFCEIIAKELYLKTKKADEEDMKKWIVNVVSSAEERIRNMPFRNRG